MSAGTPARRCDFARAIGYACDRPATRVTAESTLESGPLYWCDRHAVETDVPIPGTPSHTGEVTDGR